ncbi:hypothetical protein F4780DRAFT_259030 [Xylariomycetidae sp. FL0641]|nr:hypothetical protein F4780DRAFT_259030 [Xylariomycetidae sp. FL0641]
MLHRIRHPSHLLPAPRRPGNAPEQDAGEPTEDSEYSTAPTHGGQPHLVGEAQRPSAEGRGEASVANPDDGQPRRIDGFGDGVRLPLELHNAIQQRKLIELHQLLSEDVDLESRDAQGKKPLYLASEIGFREAADALLQAGADVESVNPESPTHSTALHRAVSGGHVGIAEVLLQNGANIDAPNQAGRTALLAAASNRDVGMVDLLLRYGADKNVSDRLGATAYQLADGSEEILSLLRAPQLLQGPATDAGGHQRSRAPRASRFRAPIHDQNKMNACHGFKAIVVDFFIDAGVEYRMEKSLSMYELLYGDRVTMDPPPRGQFSGLSRDFRWYHLPANNLEWVEILMSKNFEQPDAFGHELSDEFKSLAGLAENRDRQQAGFASPSSFMRPTCRTFKMSPAGGESSQEQLVIFAPYLHYESQPRFEALEMAMKKDHAGIRAKANSQEALKEGQPPFLQIAEILADKNPEALHQSLLRGYLRKEAPNKSESLQPRRTLDQYFYSNLDTTGRDRDQVVYRYTKEWNDPKIFMVDQLWLWITNGDTIISCAPVTIDNLMSDVAPRKPSVIQPPPAAPIVQHPGMAQPGGQSAWVRNRSTRGARRWLAELADPFPMPQIDQPPMEVPGGLHEIVDIEEQEYRLDVKYRPLSLHQNLLRYLGLRTRPPVKSPRDLACVIANSSANVFDHNEIPRDFHFFDFFERSIGDVSNVSTQLLQEFRRAAAFSDIIEVNIEEQLSIHRETELLVEIEDIQEELLILKMVIKDQQAVLYELGKSLDDRTMSESEVHSESASLIESRLLASHVQRIDNMDKMARKARKMILSLLDLKQRQATIAQALSSVAYARQGFEQAKESDRQGRTLMLFTVVTIVFLPLSFMAAFFAIEIEAFPVNDNDKLDLDYVLKYMLGISAGLSVPFIIIAFNQDRFSAWMQLFRPHLNTRGVFLVAELLLLVLLLTVVWTSSVERASKVGATIAIILLGGVLAVAREIYRLAVDVTFVQTSASRLSSDRSGF